MPAPASTSSASSTRPCPSPASPPRSSPRTARTSPCWRSTSCGSSTKGRGHRSPSPGSLAWTSPWSTKPWGSSSAPTTCAGPLPSPARRPFRGCA
ncbi:hypothetical protein ACR6C2_05130 [Streptomyces sp. INA 01156]